MTHGRLTWVRRLLLAAVLVVAAITPGSPASSGSSAQCPNQRCQVKGTVRWIRSLPGSWVAQNGMTGTSPEQGQAYAALGSRVAAVGLGTTVSAYAARTGQPLWTADLTSFRPGAAIMSVRAWPGVVTVGVGLPAAASAGTASPGTASPGTASPGTASPGTASAGTASLGTASAAGQVRDEVVLRAATGRVLRVYPAAQFGGAVAADAARTVIVGQHAVTSYANRTGKVAWSRPTGPVPQAWQVDGNHLYMSVATGAYQGAAPVTGLRRIDLNTGAERIVRPHGQAFTGALSLAFGGVVLFTDATAVRAYSETTGRLLWHYGGALPDAVDAAAGRVYLISGNTLAEVNPVTGRVLAHVAGAAAASSSGLYAVRDGDVLGIDHGAVGKAWGYDVAAQQVLWTSRRCRGRTTSWTCPGSGAAPRRTRTRCCWRSVPRWVPSQRAPRPRGASARSWSRSTAEGAGLGCGPWIPGVPKAGPFGRNKGTRGLAGHVWGIVRVAINRGIRGDRGGFRMRARRGRRPAEDAPRVIVIGAGFAGLAAVRELDRSGARVLLIDRNVYSTFQPLLYQVATGGLNPGDVAYPVRAFARKRTARFRLGELDRIDAAARTITLTDGAVLDYDYLILATGVSAAYYGITGAAEHTLGLYTRRDAVALRDHVMARLERQDIEGPGNRVNFTVVGGGATGVELAGTLAELRDALGGAFPEVDQADVHIRLVEMAPALLAPFHPSLQSYALKELRRRGVEVLLSTKISDIDADRVLLADGQELASDITVWAAGVSAPEQAQRWGLPQGRGGRIEVGPDLRVAGQARIFAVGDVALIENQPLPQLAQRPSRPAGTPGSRSWPR